MGASYPPLGHALGGGRRPERMPRMKALLLHPEFSPFGFWNYKEVCRLLGAKYPASPLGLITMAALLPRAAHRRSEACNSGLKAKIRPK